VVTVEEAGDVEIGTYVLNDDIRRVAPAAYRGVSIGKGKSFERSGVGTLNDVQTGADCEGEARQAECLDPLQIDANLICRALPPCGGTIGKLRSQRRPSAGVDAQRRGDFGKQPEPIFGELIEQRAGLVLVGCWFSRRPFAAAGGYERQGRGGSQGGDELATSK
jgi:hypothetical protein